MSSQEGVVVQRSGWCSTYGSNSHNRCPHHIKLDLGKNKLLVCSCECHEVE